MVLTDIKIRIQRNFGVERTDHIIAQLEEFYEKFSQVYKEKPSPRITRCIIKLSNSDEEKLAHYIKVALSDWRDVIYWAEYDRDGKRVWKGSSRFTSSN
jgi:hypothetical protein